MAAPPEWTPILKEDGRDCMRKALANGLTVLGKEEGFEAEPFLFGVIERQLSRMEDGAGAEVAHAIMVVAFDALSELALRVPAVVLRGVNESKEAKHSGDGVCLRCCTPANVAGLPTGVFLALELADPAPPCRVCAG